MRSFSGCGARACEETLVQLQQAVKSNPSQVNLRYQLGVCYSGLCRPHAAVCPDAALEHLRWVAGVTRESTQPGFRAGLLTLLGITYTRCSAAAPATARALAAMECYQEAAALYLAESNFPEWGRIQFNLGNAWCMVADTDFPDKWDMAIRHYEQALLVRTRENNPQGFAATLENMGSAYRERPAGDKAENVCMAVNCYRRALRICTRESAPRHWAALQNNLGNAYLSFPSTEAEAARSRARRAIRHFELALRVRTREAGVFDYAVTQLNRAQAYLRLGLDGSTQDLGEAARGFREAHGAFVEAGHPAEAKIAESGLDVIHNVLSCTAKLQSAGLS